MKITAKFWINKKACRFKLYFKTWINDWFSYLL